MKKFYIVLILTIISGKLFACDCNDTITVSNAYKNSSLIFTGKVISIVPIYQNKNQKYNIQVLVKFEIEEVYKGQKFKTIDIKTAVSTAMCGYPYFIGGTFLVYTELLKDQSKPYYFSHLCDRTRIIKDAEYDIGEIKRIRK